MKDLESFPLATRYKWKYPKRDTGGVFYLYPPTVSRPHRHRSGVDADFYLMKRERIDALNPDEVQGIEYNEAGYPRTMRCNGQPPNRRRGESP